MTIGYTPNDEQIVEQLLREAEMEDAVELKDALLELRSFAIGPRIEPSAELAALMTTPPISLDVQRKRRHRRAGMVALAVAASMGMGTAAVAATDSGFREKAQETIEQAQENISMVIDTLTRGHSGWKVPGTSSPEPPGHDPDHQKPARGIPEHSNQESRPAPTPGQGKTEQESGSLPNPGASPATPRSKGTTNTPAAPEKPQKTGNGLSLGSPAEGRPN
jgi:hypothetical protein